MARNTNNMNWLKGLGSSIWVVLLGGLAVLAAVLSKGSPRKWQKKAISNEELHLQDAAADATEAFADSDRHNTAATKIIDEAKAEAEEVKDSEESMDDLLKRLRS